MSERSLLQWIRTHVGVLPSWVRTGPGDDCAVLRLGGEDHLLKVDTVVERIHFTRRDPLEWVGHKALARPLSDIAAMGGVPRCAVTAVVLPRSLSEEEARRIHRGQRRLGIPLVGGDIASHDGPLTISVTVLGAMDGARPVLRSGARPGDAILVTGPLGRSHDGKHLRFRPRLREGRLFATKLRVRAMIDISDGLATDLGHLCEEGGVGADLDAARIPRSRGASLDEALHDGEDYELLVAAPARIAAAIERRRLGVRIGTVSARAGMRLRLGSGEVRRLVPAGYEHRFGV